MSTAAPRFAPRETRPEDRVSLRWLVAATFVVILNETTMINAVSRLMEAFSVDERAAQWLSTIFLLGMAVVIPVTGWFLQRVTTRQAFTLAMGTFLAGTVLAGLAWSFPVLLVARAVQATGTAVMLPLLMTTLMTVVAERDRGRVMGNVTMAISVAPALGPAASGLVLGFASWRWIFALVVVVAAAITLAGLRNLRNVGERGHTPVDWASLPIAALGFGGVVYGLSRLGEGAAVVPLAILGVGIVAVVAFVARQIVLQRSDRPLLDLRTLQHREYAVAVALMSVSFMAMLGALFLLPQYLQRVVGLTELQTGLLVMPGGLAMGLMGPRVGRWYDARGARVLVIPGAVGMVTAMVGLASLGAHSPVWLVFVLHVILMVSLALIFTPVFTIGLGALPGHQYSHGSSLLGTVQQVAAAAGTALVVTVMAARRDARIAAGVDPTEALASGMQWAFAIGAVLAVGVLLLALRVPRRVPGGSDDADDDASSPEASPETEPAPAGH